MSLVERETSHDTKGAARGAVIVVGTVAILMAPLVVVGTGTPDGFDFVLLVFTVPSVAWVMLNAVYEAVRAVVTDRAAFYAARVEHAKQRASLGLQTLNQGGRRGCEACRDAGCDLRF